MTSTKKALPTRDPKTETVKLLKPHTHAGVDCKPGDKIDVSPPEKAWLIQQNVIAANAERES